MKKLGLDNYSWHPKTGLLLASYAIDDGSEQVIDAAHGERPRSEFIEAWRDPSVQIVAHNAQFDRVLMMNCVKQPAPIDRWYDTKSRAYSHGMPGALEMLSKIFQLGDDSKKDGERLIELFCERGANPDDFPGDWAQFMEYSAFDITSLRRLYKMMPDWCWTEREQRIYHLDQRINDRGFKVDLALATKIIEASEQATASLNGRVQALTDNLIQKGTQREKVQNWLNSLSQHSFDDMRAETLRKAVRDHKSGQIELDPYQLAMIELRLLSSKSSISKCKTALNQAGPGSRIRYAMNYGGAGRILRFSHKGFQPGNMPRPTRKKEDIEEAITALQADACYTIYGDESMSVGADCLRGLIVASDNHKIASADYSNIEGRVLAWFAGEEWKLKAYRDKDAGVGEDIYKLQVHRAMGIPLEEITDFLRQQGKGMDLSMGYEGGVGAFINVANSYQLDLVEIARAAPRTMPAEYMERARGSWAWAQKHGMTQGLPESIYVACAALRDSYRDANSKIRALWQDLLNCAKAAYGRPGIVFETAGGKVKIVYTPGWLGVKLPSGRAIMFAKPKIVITKRIYTNDDGDVIEDEGKPSLTALKSPSWTRRPTYGGLFANAITQGFARDILCDALLDLDAEGWPIILHVHDDVNAELEESDPRNHKDMIEVMLRQTKRYPGLPLNANGFTALRLRKG